MTVIELICTSCAGTCLVSAVLAWKYCDRAMKAKVALEVWRDAAGGSLDDRIHRATMLRVFRLVEQEIEERRAKKRVITPPN